MSEESQSYLDHIPKCVCLLKAKTFPLESMKLGIAVRDVERGDGGAEAGRATRGPDIEVV